MELSNQVSHVMMEYSKVIVSYEPVRVTVVEEYLLILLVQLDIMMLVRESMLESALMNVPLEVSL